MASPSYVDVLQSHIQISGMDQPLSIVIVDGEDGLLSCQVEELFGFSQFQIRLTINVLGLFCTRVKGNGLALLKSEGIVSMRAAQTLFISRENLRILIEEIGSSEHVLFYRSIWAPLSMKSERSSPKRSFRAGMIRNVRRQNEKIRRLELQLEELSAIVEDLLRKDTNEMTLAMARASIAPRHLSLGPEGDNTPRGQFSEN
ncbi:MAG: hypothetical protein M3Q07_23130 [Pseudobdellovibrionaceae bacterium]|nr:hypothetical protein [Pseudobdellovibrionaceae bacterium]